jgi:hypothetical protein
LVLEENNMSDILILANSRKNRGFCVAGKDIETNKWVRLVGDSNGAELNLNQIIYQDLANRRQMVQYEPLNKIIRLDLGNAVPLRYQPENILIGQNLWQEIQAPNHNIIFDTPVDLWGASDRIRADDISQERITITQSLYLIQATNLKFYINDYNTNRACFQYGNNEYDLGATINPFVFQELAQGLRSHNNILTISLAGPFFNKYTRQYEHYKLVAAVF